MIHLSKITGHINALKAYLDMIRDTKIYLSNQERADFEDKIDEEINNIMQVIAMTQMSIQAPDLLSTQYKIPLSHIFGRFQPNIDLNDKYIYTNMQIAQVALHNLSTLMSMAHIQPEYTIVHDKLNIHMVGMTDHIQTAFEWHICRDLMTALGWKYNINDQNELTISIDIII